MANEEQFNILKQGIAVWNKWREQYFLVKIDLGQADLRGAVLTGANLAAADLRGANLSQTDLREAIISGAKLGGCNFWKAVMGNTIFGNSDLSEAIGLEQVVHLAPSRIAADTFALSKGKIPEVFLRGCGLNNHDIESPELTIPNSYNEEMNRRFMSEPGCSGFAASYLVEHKQLQEHLGKVPSPNRRRQALPSRWMWLRSEYPIMKWVRIRKYETYCKRNRRSP